MKAFLTGLILILLFNGLFAQQTDSLKSQSVYRHAWDTAMKDGKISSEERALMEILVGSLLLPIDSSSALEIQWSAGLNTQQPLDQSGRWPLVLQNIAIGAGLYGWGIPYVLHAENGRWFVGSEMISMGGAFYLTYQYTKNMEMSHARTQMMRYGSLLGLRYGLGVNQLLDLTENSGDQRETLWAWILMASVPAGHYGGELLFDQYKPSNGQAWAWTMWTGVAGVTARLIHSVVDSSPYDDDEYTTTSYEDWKKRKTIVELIAYPAGAIGGYHLSKNKQYTFGDALMLMQGWGFGYLNTMMVQSMLFDEGDEDMFLLVSSLGAIGHTFYYDRWISNDDFTFGQSTLMLLGSGSGTAFGFGIAILFDITDKEPMLGLALAGYGAGTYLTRKILDVSSDGSLTHSSSSRVSLNPTALAVLGSDNKIALIPALDLRISFK